VPAQCRPAGQRQGRQPASFAGLEAEHVEHACCGRITCHGTPAGPAMSAAASICACSSHGRRDLRSGASTSHQLLNDCQLQADVARGWQVTLRVKDGPTQAEGMHECCSHPQLGSPPSQLLLVTAWPLTLATQSGLSAVAGSHEM